MKKTGLFKKCFLPFAMLICMLTFTACGAETKVSADKTTQMEASAGYIVYTLTSGSEAELLSITDINKEAFEGLYADNSLRESANIRLAAFQEAVQAYLAEQDELGAYKGNVDLADDGNIYITDEYTVSESASGEISFTVHSQFEKHDADLEFVFDADLMLDSFSINTNYSTGEILTKAGLNTLLGMGTVFTVLILIAFLISLFKYIPAIQAKFQKKAEIPAAEPVPAVVPVQAVQEEELTDDLELVAVISAAIAASEHTTTDGFVVRSIKRRKSNRW